MKNIKVCFLTGVLAIIFTICFMGHDFSSAYAEEQSFLTERPDINIVINGNAGEYVDVPIIINDRTLLPLRAILINLGVPNDGSHIIWNNEEQSVRVISGEKDVKLTLDNPLVKVNEKEITMDVCPVIYKDRTYIPARFVAQSLGMKVAWDEETQTVAIGSEENYNQVKKLLESNIQAMKNANRFINTQTYNANIINKFSTIENNVEINLVSNMKVNNQEEKCLANANMLTDTNGEKNKTEIETWIDKNDIYIKQKPNNIWQQPILTDEQIRNEKKKSFNTYYFLEATDFNCTALNVRTSETKDQIKLYGEFLPAELIKTISESGTLNKDTMKLYFKDHSTEILMDQSTNIATYVCVNTGTYIDEEDFLVDAKFVLDWTISELNGDFKVELSDQISGSSDNSIDTANQLLEDGKYDDAIKVYNEVIKSDLDNYDAYFGRAVAEYYVEDYENSIKDIDKAIELNKDELYFFTWKAKNFIAQGEYEEAVKSCDQVLNKDNMNDFAYNVKGYALSCMGKNNEALENIEKAISIDNEYEDAYLNKVSILYYQKNYSACIEFGEKIKDKFSGNYDIPWYMADSYMALYDYENALKLLQNVLAIVPENSYANSQAGWCYFYNEDYQEAEKYANKALEIDNSNYSAKDLKTYLEEQKLPEAERIANFVKNNYLYLDKVKDFDKKTKEFTARKEITSDDIDQYINSIKLEDDMFTYMVSGEEFDQYKEFEKENHLYTKKINDSMYYVGILSFTSSVGVEFKNFVDNIENSENASLIIDLRDNSGGLLQPANDILDCLLPKCTTSFSIDRNGDIYTYYSDEENVSFKKIYILVNKNSASSSELLALGLKKFLQNVTIIGQPTVGKGVGQNTYTSKNEKYIIYLVNFYWNVKEQNIMGGKITPDILVEGEKIEDYLKHIK